MDLKIVEKKKITTKRKVSKKNLKVLIFGFRIYFKAVAIRDSKLLKT